MSINSNFSKAIYYKRKEMGLTQEEAAEKLDISTRWFQMVENGKHIPGGELVLKIIVFFGIDSHTLSDEKNVLLPNS